MSDVPTRTRSQKDEALEKANAVRLYRALLKRMLRAKQSPRTIIDIVSAPVWQEETWKVREVLLCRPRWGNVKVDALLRQLDISQAKTVAGMSDRQRRVLLEVLSR